MYANLHVVTACMCACINLHNMYVYCTYILYGDATNFIVKYKAKKVSFARKL